jgi:hypothetical protein
MAWEKRQRGNGYYYRKRKIGGRVVSEYIGAGYLAEQQAERDQLEREREAQERAAWQRMVNEQRETDQELDQLEQTIKALVSVQLQAAGYHKHKGQWRRKRCQKNAEQL